MVTGVVIKMMKVVVMLMDEVVVMLMDEVVVMLIDESGGNVDGRDDEDKNGSFINGKGE